MAGIGITHAAMLLDLQGRWFALDGDRLVELPVFPDLEVPALVVSDFEGSMSGVMAMEGAVRHASPLIDKRLRTEALSDGETHVVIEDIRRIGKGFRALYTAVPIAVWQRLSAWAERGADHRLTVSLTGLFARLLTQGKQSNSQAIVVRNGRQFLCLWRGPEGIELVSSLAFGDGPDDLEHGVASLISAMKQGLSPTHGISEIVWYALSPSPDTAAEDGLMTTASALTGWSIRRGALDALRMEGVPVPVQSHWPRLSRVVRARDAVMPGGWARWLYNFESALPMLSLAALGLAAGLGGMVWMNAQKVQACEEMIASLTQQTRAIQAEAARLHVATSPASADIAMLETLVKAHASFDFIRLLRTLKNAAGEGVRIMRVYLDERTRQIRVEGVAAGGGGHLARFVDALRQKGLAPQAVDAPQSGSGLPGFFSYALLSLPEAVPDVQGARP